MQLGLLWPNKEPVSLSRLTHTWVSEMVYLLTLQNSNEGWDISEVNISAAITIRFGYKITALQDCNERWDIIKVNIPIHVTISLQCTTNGVSEDRR